MTAKWMIVLLLILCVVGTAQAAQFQEVNSLLNLPGAIGAAWGDYNADGLPDLFITGNENLGHGAHLLRNDGGLVFTDVSAATGIPTTLMQQISCVWADFDNNGFLDIYVGSDGPLLNALYSNDNGYFSDVAEQAGITDILVSGNANRTAAWCDYDNDNWMDIFVCAGDARLLHNNGDGSFSDATSSAGMTGEAQPIGAHSCAWGDYDEDGWSDLIVTRPEPFEPLLYHNNGNGTFTDIGAFLTVVNGGAGVAWGDYDNDGKLDFYITSGPNSSNDWLFHNNGDNTFTDVATTAGMAGDMSSSDSIAWADYDNDGHLDIYVGNTQAGGESLLYHNNSNGTFTNVAHTQGMTGTYHDEAAAWADIDLDGRIDLFQAGQLISRLFHNIGSTGNWLRVRTLTSSTGDATGSEPLREAIGARVDLNLDNDDTFPAGRTLVRLIDGGSSFLAQNEQVAHFGVGLSSTVAVRVRFPDGSVVIHRSVPVNQQITISDVPADREEIFDDVPLDYWAYSQTKGCVEAGIVFGYPDGTYQPSNPVTRDQMAVYVARALAGGDASVPEFSDTPTFPDVPSDFWALKYVEYAVDQGVVGGYEDGTYRPTNFVDRGTMAVYIARALVAPLGESGLADYVPADPRNFPDVPSDYWSYKHIEYCVEQGIVNGYGDGTYQPANVVTRDQMAVYVARAFDLE
jgi:hypothetical protein